MPVRSKWLSLTVGQLLCNQLKALSKESSLLKMHVILIEISKHVNN